jgi:hypothetical protein
VDIKQQAGQLPVQHAAVEVIVVVTVHIHIHRIHQHRILHQVVVEVAEVVVAQEVQSLAGHALVLQFITHLPK